VAIDANTRSAPAGVKDSKLLTPAAREALVPKLRRWAPAHAVGHAEPDEIDRIGVIAALRLAAWRAVAALPVQPDCVLLDGNHDYFTEPPPRAEDDCDQPGEPLFELPPSLVAETPETVLWPSPPVVSRVVTRIKADLRCAAVAAASVIAKVERDAIMTARAVDHPQYGWEVNKGYSAPEHIAALREHGACPQHRRSWSLPGLLAAGAIPGQDMLDLAEAALDLSAFDPELAAEADR
jgi:ribonuclease HII